MSELKADIHFLPTIEQKVIPWVEQLSPGQFVIAAPTMEEMEKISPLPLTSYPIKGKRELVNAAEYSGEVVAHWRDAGLLETKTAMLLFVLNGQADLRCGDYVLHAPRGTAVFIPAGVPRWDGKYLYPLRPDGPGRISDNLLFNSRFGLMQMWFNHYRSDGHSISNVMFIRNYELARLLEQIQHEAAAAEFGADKCCWHLLNLFVLQVQRELKTQHNVSAVGWPNVRNPGSSASLDYNPIVKAQQYIEAHLHHQLTQDKVAKIVRLSRTQFIKRFHRETGQTFHQYVTAHRMELLKILLRDSNYPVSVIMHIVGYRSRAHLYRAFVKHTSLLPLEYRKQHRQNIDQNHTQATEWDV